MIGHSGAIESVMTEGSRLRAENRLPNLGTFGLLACDHGNRFLRNTEEGPMNRTPAGQPGIRDLALCRTS